MEFRVTAEKLSRKDSISHDDLQLTTLSHLLSQFCNSVKNYDCIVGVMLCGTCDSVARSSIAWIVWIRSVMGRHSLTQCITVWLLGAVCPNWPVSSLCSIRHYESLVLMYWMLHTFWIFGESTMDSYLHRVIYLWISNHHGSDFRTDIAKNKDTHVCLLFLLCILLPI